MESADPIVIKSNFLKACPEGIKSAIEMVNSIGSIKENGIPKLLPGINLIHGLIGENRDTFRLNYEFLKDIVDSGLLIRRINIRQIKLSKNTLIQKSNRISMKEEKKLDAGFRNYREKIRNEIDASLMQQIFPAGLVLTDLIVECHRGDWSIARPIGTYPIAVNIPRTIPVYSKISVFIIGYRERSLIGLPHPFYLKSASLQELKQIPGLSKKAGELFVNKTFPAEIFLQLPIFEKIKNSLIF